MAGYRKIRASHVAVVGVGGVGSWTAEALARAGVGQITLIDLDHVSESNVNRQVHALTNTLGMAKVIAMRNRIHEIQPGCLVNIVEQFLDGENCESLLTDGLTAVVDACDQSTAKFALAKWALNPLRQTTVFVCCGAAGGKTEANLVEIADLARTTHDPLLASLRSRLRRDGTVPRSANRTRIECVFSREEISVPEAVVEETLDGNLSCHGYGSSVAVTATFGMVAAGRVMKRIAQSVRLAN